MELNLKHADISDFHITNKPKRTPMTAKAVRNKVQAQRIRKLQRLNCGEAMWQAGSHANIPYENFIKAMHKVGVRALQLEGNYDG